MSNREDHIALFRKMLAGNCTIEERQLLIDWLGSDMYPPDAADIIAEYMGSPADASYVDPDVLKKLQIRLDNILRNDAVKHIYRPYFLLPAAKYFKYAAAIIVLLLGVTIYFTLSNKAGKDVVQSTASTSTQADVMPGSDRAILTLSNGRQIELNNTASETINDEDLSIKNSNGEVIYERDGAGRASDGQKNGSGTTATGESLNTMTTPRGGQYKLTLSDGTRIWLNAASSITFPASFSGKAREVSITGEVYFEVTANKDKPFIIKTFSDQITVLGTSFNVNAYEDESSVKTSLLEGSIKIGDTFIKPGQAYQNGKIKQANVQQDIAWKNGYFNFNGIDLTTVMNQLARWYDVKIIYEKGVPDIRFGGKMERSLKLSQVLTALDAMGLEFVIKGDSIIVKNRK